MCFFDQWEFACKCFKWGHFRQHCSKEYRTGETCGMKLVMNRHQSTEKCKICTKIAAKERSIAREEERLRRWRLRYGEQQILTTGETRTFRMSRAECAEKEARIQEARIQEARMQEAQIQKMKMDVIVLRDILSNTVGQRLTSEPTSALLSLTLPNEISSNREGPCPIPLMSLSSITENQNSKALETQRFMPNKTLAHPLIDLSHQQIRLFELTSTTGASHLEGVFHVVSLSTLPTYTALSYTWGDPAKTKLIEIGGNGLAIPLNLWWFLHSWNSSKLEKTNIFWIDAICIDQTNILERNHQVRLMKKIYTNAAKVVVWLGQEADNSDVAMNFMATQGSAPLKRKGCGYKRLWTKDEGRALLALCDRAYWRRIWIIQEIIHAEKITVLCGKKSFEWKMLESLYGKLKTLELESWLLHHESAAGILSSSASVMVWQRAHWRHPETPKPHLNTLLEVFQDWKCSDIRDKVYGLLGMVDEETAVVVDYSKSVGELYEALRERELEHDSIIGKDYRRFCSLFRKVLKLAEY